MLTVQDIDFILGSLDKVSISGLRTAGMLQSVATKLALMKREQQNEQTGTDRPEPGDAPDSVSEEVVQE